MEPKIEKISMVNLKFCNKFDCGNKTLNNYLKEKAYRDCDSVTNIIRDKGSNKIIAFFSLSCGAIYLCTTHVKKEEQSSQNLKFTSFPAVEIKHFAVNKEYQDTYIVDEDTNKSYLLSGALLDYIKNKVIMEFTEKYCGASRIILYSTPQAVNFYETSGFESFYEDFVIDNSSYLEGCTPMIYNYD